MIDRLRVLLDAPLEPRVARALIAVAACVTIAFAIVVGLLGLGGSPDSQRSTTTARRPSAPPLSVEAVPRETPSAEPSPPSPVHRRQDPQDRRGTPAFRRAKKALRSHRALQHLPYRTGRLTVTLVGADHGRAMLRVQGSSVEKAKAGWRRFLHRFHDSAHSYEPRFTAKPTRGQR